MTTFRFDAADHAYYLDNEQIPSITQMLDRTGWTSDMWYTEESSARGTAVHELTAHYDLGALDPSTCVSKFRGYLLSHVKAMQIIPHEHHAVEEPSVHRLLRFGGRPDRVGIYYSLRGVLEGKSGASERSHQIQTALQAILEAERFKLPPEALGRFCLYWKKDGKFKLEKHEDKRDFDEARRVIRTCTACAA